jgi:penicillin-binding protein 1C
MKTLRRWLKRSAIALALPAVALWITWLLLPKPELLPPGAEFSHVVLDRDGRVLFLSLTRDGKYRLPVKLDDISPELLNATLEMEDRRFFSHHGADPRSLLRAAWGAVTGQRLGGGSTLTMQYARLRWGLQTRTLWGKCVQLFRAAQIERHHGKREIAGAYFTFAPYGGNVEGAAAASLLWCGKSAHDLSLREAAALSVLPQSPTKRRPRADGTISQSAKSAQARLMARLRIARGEEQDAMDAEFTLRPIAPPRLAPPRLAPHYARRVASGNTTLDLAQQQTIERSIADFLTREHSRGLHNAAAILVHAPTREVRAYVGSAGFLNSNIAGQVDGVTARRSPGSALKPFIYALAFEEGIIQPHTLLDDAPRRFSAYNPENSDRSFLGPIPAGEALRRSRNVPAVELLSRLHGGGLDTFLRSSGVKLAREPGEYGLSLALGGAEVSLEDLAMLYAMLADDGVARPLIGSRNFPAPALSSGQRMPGLESPGCRAARWLTLDALRGNEPGSPRGLAWKTGTSHGFRDTWACGVMGDWVLCMWVGNFDGKPMPGLFARDTAAPLLFQTVTRLGLRAKPTPRPAEIVDVRLCAITGELAGPHCAHRTAGKFIAGVSPITTCPVHREVTLADGTRKIREFWPEHRLEQFRRAGLPRVSVADLADKTRTGPPPRIISPQPKLTYAIHVGDAVKNTIPLEADATADARQIHWFAGTHYLGASAPSHPLMWKAAPGRWHIQAVDDAGRVAKMSVTVVAAQ